MEREWADAIFDKVIAKFQRSIPLAESTGIIPYKSVNGKWVGPPFDGNSWWTNGFWPALMWQLFAATKDEAYAQEARRVEALLIDELLSFRKLNHDVGFMYQLSCGADYLLTGDPVALRHTLHAANLLAGRFNPLGFIRAWNGKGREGWSIIDTMMNLPLLYWASNETGDPRFSKIARIHSDTSLRYFVRADGSCNHIVIFDANTGEMLDAPAGQGCAPGSSWSRGQAWGLYGYTIGYMFSEEAQDLKTARSIANYFIAHIRKDGLTDCDFMQPDEEERIDNIAAAIAACALIELSRMVEKEESDAYMDAAIEMLRALDSLCADWSDDSPGILQKCTASYNDDGAGRHENIVYGDYFFIEALSKLRKTDPMIWGVKR